MGIAKETSLRQISLGYVKYVHAQSIHFNSAKYAWSIGTALKCRYSFIAVISITICLHLIISDH